MKKNGNFFRHLSLSHSLSPPVSLSLPSPSPLNSLPLPNPPPCPPFPLSRDLFPRRLTKGKNK